MGKNTDTYDTQLSAACLLLSIANADQILKHSEINIIVEILIDFFTIDASTANTIIIEAKDTLNKSTDIFHFVSNINTNFTKNDKIDFIKCIFEVAYSDGELHYIEHHMIKKIANIMHLERNDVIQANIDIKEFL